MIRRSTNLAALLATMSLVSGCTVIHFDNGERQYEGAETLTQWHHSFVFETIEGSAPVDLAAVCKSREWRTVTSEHAYSSVIAASLLWEPVGASALISGLWTPRAIKVRCSD